MKQTQRREVAEPIRAWWRRAVTWVRNNPRPAVFTAAGAVLLVLLVLWLLPTGVRTVTLERREVVETLVTTGRVRSVSRAQVGTSIGGTVDRVEVGEGDRVSADELVIALDDAEATAAVQEARARLVAAEAELGRLSTVELPSSAATLEAAEMEARQLWRDVERLEVLYEAGGLSLQELEVAQRTAEAAQARLERARTTTVSLSSGGADRAAAEAGVVQARESLDAALARLELTRVRAPAAGTVLTRDVEPGDAVQPGRVLMEIAVDGPTELIVFPDERTVSGLREGQAAVASADAYPDQRFAATVTHVAPVVDPQQGTIEVRLAVPSPPAYLLPDMTVSVNVEMARRADAWTLPLGTVRAPLTDTAWVLVVRGGRAERTPVDVGIRDDRVIEIVGGIEPDERVIAEPPGEVEPGERVWSRPLRRADG